MDEFGGFGAVRAVEVDVLTDAYRISGMVQTRFNRVTDILNQQTSTFLDVTHATISEYDDPTATRRLRPRWSPLVDPAVMTRRAFTGESGGEMRIQSGRSASSSPSCPSA